MRNRRIFFVEETDRNRPRSDKPYALWQQVLIERLDIDTTLGMSTAETFCFEGTARDGWTGTKGTPGADGVGSPANTPARNSPFLP